MVPCTVSLGANSLQIDSKLQTSYLLSRLVSSLHSFCFNPLIHNSPIYSSTTLLDSIDSHHTTLPTLDIISRQLEHLPVTRFHEPALQKGRTITEPPSCISQLSTYLLRSFRWYLPTLNSQRRLLEHRFLVEQPSPLLGPTQEMRLLWQTSLHTPCSSFPAPMQRRHNSTSYQRPHLQRQGHL